MEQQLMPCLFTLLPCCLAVPRLQSHGVHQFDPQVVDLRRCSLLRHQRHQRCTDALLGQQKGGRHLRHLPKVTGQSLDAVEDVGLCTRIEGVEFQHVAARFGTGANIL